MNRTNQSALPNRQSLKRPAARDMEIVAAARAGCPRAFSELYALYHRRIYKTIFSITRHQEDAEDVLQDTFLRVYLSLHTFEGRSSFYSWLTQVAINSALMCLRKRRSCPETLLDLQHDNLTETIFVQIRDPGPTPEQVCDLRQRGVGVLRALRNLKPGLREPIEMQITGDRTMREISRALNISIASVKARLHRARLRLYAVHALKGFRDIEPGHKDITKTRTTDPSTNGWDRVEIDGRVNSTSVLQTPRSREEGN